MFFKKKKKEEKSFWRLKRAILGELLEDYPEGAVYGKVEYFLKSKGYAVDVLEKHDIIERLSQADKNKIQTGEEERKKDWYRLTSKGVDLAISMIQLDYSKKVKELTEKIRWLTILILVVGLGSFILIWFQLRVLG